MSDLRGGDAAHNAQIVRDVLGGAEGPVRDAVLLNTAAGLAALEVSPEGDLVSRLRTHMESAAESIDSGAASRVLREWVAFSQS